MQESIFDDESYIESMAKQQDELDKQEAEGLFELADDSFYTVEDPDLSFGSAMSDMMDAISDIERPSIRDVCRLNNEQKLAAFQEGNAMCLAGAGSGKTETSVVRMHDALERTGEPHRILSLTFTKKASEEIRERIARVSNNPLGKAIITGTFHSWCSRHMRYLMKRDHCTIEGRGVNFSIANDSAQKKIIKGFMDEDAFLQLSGSDVYVDTSGDRPVIKPQLFLYKYLARKDQEVELGFDMGSDADNHLALNYEKAMRINNAMDFSDIINICIRYLQANPDARPRYSDVIIDEFQDTSMTQYKLLWLITEDANVFAVGDIDQSIYEWRSAKPENINRFVNDFEACLLKLEQNYRSTPAIVNGANEMIANNINRVDKVMRSNMEAGKPIRFAEPETEAQQAQMVVRDIVSLRHDVYHSGKKRSVGIIYRKNAHSLAIEQELTKNGIPYHVKKDSGFLKRREIQAAMSLIDCLANPHNQMSFSSGIASFVKGVSINKAHEIINSLRSGYEFDFSGAVATHELLGQERSVNGVSIHGVKLTKPAGIALSMFLDKLEVLRRASPSEIASEIVDSNYFKKPCTSFSGDKGDKSVERIENYEQFCSWLAKYKKIGDFIESLTLDASTDDEHDVEVNLMTIHGSKGLEFDQVYIIHATEESFLGAVGEGWEYEEARRLMYVAITRARHVVTILSPKFVEEFSYSKRARKSIKQKVPQHHCHFVEEISPENMPKRPAKEGQAHRFLALKKNIQKTFSL